MPTLARISEIHLVIRLGDYKFTACSSSAVRCSCDCCFHWALRTAVDCSAGVGFRSIVASWLSLATEVRCALVISELGMLRAKLPGGEESL